MILSQIQLAAVLPPAPPIGSPQQLMGGAITFFTTWIARVGGVVALIGAIKFALSIKNDDSKEMLTSLLVMVSGFIISSATSSGIFTVSSGMTADAEFTQIMQFIARWLRRVGAVGTLIGAVMFGFSIKDNNATTKISALKTFAAGAMTMAITAIWTTFV